MIEVVANFIKVYVPAPEGVNPEDNYYYTLESSSISEYDLDSE